ncbi:MAG: arsenate reductase ArsC [Rhodocyclaceae bacterium]|nr:arsenate reductase ArsC [Rhodocyclaceae bacterium]
MTINILVLCTGNSARSILGEMLFNHLGKGRVKAYSAGSQPAGKVNPVAIETLQKHGIPCEGARSKSWDEFAKGAVQKENAETAGAVPRAPTFHYIFTVCGNAAQEVCPVWPGHPTTAHWGIDDPAHVEPLEARREAFEKAYQELRARVAAFLALPLEGMSPEEANFAARHIHARQSGNTGNTGA